VASASNGTSAKNGWKVWAGIVTWTATNPGEVLVSQGYNSSVTANTAHGKPLTAPCGNGQVAVLLVKPPSETPTASFSYPFIGNCLAFHALGGTLTTVTHIVYATAKEPPRQYRKPHHNSNLTHMDNI
jgi:hypothetical protein